MNGIANRKPSTFGKVLKLAIIIMCLFLIDFDTRVIAPANKEEFTILTIVAVPFLLSAAWGMIDTRGNVALGLAGLGLIAFIGILSTMQNGDSKEALPGTNVERVEPESILKRDENDR